MAVITYRIVKGSRLTIAEGDDNIHNLDDRVTVIENDPPAAVSIDTITSDGAALTVVLTDATELGPFDLPKPNFTPRGAWSPVTEYFYGNTVSANGGVYFVNIPHTSAASFDPGESDTSGSFYALMFEWPDNVLPTGGSIGTKLKKSSASDYDVEWGFDAIGDLSDVDIATDLAIGDNLAWNGGAWTNSAATFALETLSDVDYGSPGPVDRDLLIFDDGTNKWIPGQLAFSDISGVASSAQIPAISTLSGTVADTQLLQVKRQAVTASTSSLSINRALGEIVALSLGATVTTFTVSNWPASGLFARLVLHVNNTGAFNITTWPTNTIWAGGTPPTITSGSGKKDIVILTTYDAGTTIYGNVVGQDFA